MEVGHLPAVDTRTMFSPTAILLLVGTVDGLQDVEAICVRETFEIAPLAVALMTSSSRIEPNAS
jgi:hypothetical protein